MGINLDMVLCYVYNDINNSHSFYDYPRIAVVSQILVKSKSFKMNQELANLTNELNKYKTKVTKLQDALEEACDVLEMAADVIEDLGEDSEEIQDERDRIARLRTLLEKD